MVRSWSPRRRRERRAPFTDLCRQALGEDGLEITIVHGGVDVGVLRFEDWAAQADVGLSPTAGWGVPANAIEFWADDPGSHVVLSLSLAATSVGRGWHTVGHAAGVYRNRMRLTPLPQ
ncbi:MAG: hypothetical protein AAF721_26485 [Myxococcota bacterium]